MGGRLDTAADIAKAVSAGDRTPREAVEASLAAADRLESLNVFTRLDPDRALSRAGAGDVPGPLSGVPIALKDIIDEEGVPTTAGSSFLRIEPDRPAEVTRRLEVAGAVVVGRTGLHEFAYGFSSENPWFGPVRNPWDPVTSPGGSSGGSAAAVAAGIVPVAIGTDTGGSVRVPAAMCGVVGLKTSHGRVSLRGVFPLGPSLDTVGPLTRTVGDAALVYRVLAGFDREDPWSAPVAVDPPAGSADLGGLRMAVPVPWTERPMAQEVAAGFAAGIEMLKDRGVVVERVSCPGLMPSSQLSKGLGPEVAEVHREWFERHPERYGPDVAAKLRTALTVDESDLVVAQRLRASVTHAAAELLRRYDVLLTPTTTVLRKVIGDDRVATEEGLVPFQGAISWFTSLVNRVGMPALSLPLQTAGGPPPSIQLIGPMWSEERLLAIGTALEVAGIVGTTAPPEAHQ